MLATSPWFSTVGSWPDQLDHDNPTVIHDDHHISCWKSAPATVDSSDINFCSNQQLWFGSSEPYISVGEEDQPSLGGRVDVAAAVTKKRNHNESERDRRKKINGLYSALRSLLPAPEQNKKLSIPATVSRVVKYIPELQKEVESLLQKKEKLIASSSVSLQSAGNLTRLEMRRERKSEADQCSSSCSVSVSKLGDTEFIIQISTSKTHKRVSSLSHVLMMLEENGISVVDVSSFRSIGGCDFFTVHLTEEGTHGVTCEWLRRRLLSLYEQC